MLVLLQRENCSVLFVCVGVGLGVCVVVVAAMVRWVLGLCRTQGRRSFLLRKESVVGLVHLFSSSSRHGFASSSEAAAAVGAPPRALQHHGPGKLVGKTALITGQ